MACFVVLSLFLIAVCARIYTAYQRNLHQRLAAEQKVLSLSQQRAHLIRVLCHDLGNPVSSIAGFIGYVEKAEGERRQKSIEMIKRSVAGAQAIIDGVRKMQALESGKLALEVTEQKLADLVGDAVASLDARIRDKGIQLEIKVDPELRVQVEKTSFVHTVLANVLSNAIKFSEPKARIEITSTTQPGGSVDLVIRDHGIGMPVELQTSIFSEVSVTSRPGTAGEQGTGFGMPLARKFVLAYGGKIGVESHEAPDEHHGTAVKIELKSAA
jgi:signal transduction histidine kinase